MTARLDPRHCLLGTLCVGIAAANASRAPWLGIAAAAVALACLAAASSGAAGFALAAGALLLAGWWWGSVRLDTLDRSVLVSAAGTAERTVLVVTGPPRVSRFQIRLPAQVRRFGRVRVREAVLLELPVGRSPPQGAILETVAEVVLPPGPDRGFDERRWLRRHGIHVVLQAERWRLLGRRAGLGGVADRVRRVLARGIAPGLHGERRALVEGVVLGDDQALSESLRDRFRAAGLYHLLAVSGQNVVLVAGGALLCAWLAGVPRWLGELGALAAIFGYVLAVGAQPSVVRAGVAGALGSLAWLAARERDRWYFLLLGALALLAWNPYSLLDAGFQLSFAAVAAIFVLVPRFRRELEGYPVPGGLADAVAVSTACGLATAPVLWLQFHGVPLLSVPANALAAPAMLPLLGLAFAAAAVQPLSPGAAEVLAWLNGWCAAYLAGCARLVGSLPLAQVRSGWVLAAIAAVAGGACAYAWRR